MVSYRAYWKVRTCDARPEGIVQDHGRQRRWLAEDVTQQAGDWPYGRALLRFDRRRHEDRLGLVRGMTQGPLREALAAEGMAEPCGLL
jgi:hypothetical protein